MARRKGRRMRRKPAISKGRRNTMRAVKRIMAGADYIGSNLIVKPIRSGPGALPPGLRNGGMMHKSCKCKVAKKCMCT